MPILDLEGQLIVDHLGTSSASKGVIGPAVKYRHSPPHENADSLPIRPSCKHFSCQSASGALAKTSSVSWAIVGVEGKIPEDEFRWRTGPAAAAASDQDPAGSGAATRVPTRAVEGHSTKCTRERTDGGVIASIVASIAQTRLVHTSPVSATTGSDDLTSWAIVDPTSGELAKTLGAASSGTA